MRKFILTPGRGSRGGLELSGMMGIPRLVGKRLANHMPDPQDVIINWGNSALPGKLVGCRIINEPEAVAKAVNKKTAFETMVDVVTIPPFTASMETAKRWVELGNKVVARHILVGSSGDGIQILGAVDDFPCEAPLYTLYVPKTFEYRAHVMDGIVFDVQKKMRRKDIPDDKVNWQIRNHDNGFIFGRRDIGGDDNAELKAVETQAKKAVKALGLDFGAVDIIWNKRQQQAYVLEVNTAPGLEGETMFNYCESLSDLINGNMVINKLAGLRPRKIMVENFKMAGVGF